MKKVILALIIILVVTILCCLTTAAIATLLINKSKETNQALILQNDLEEKIKAEQKAEEAKQKDAALFAGAPVAPATVKVGSIEWKINGASDKGSFLKSNYPGFAKDCKLENGSRYIFIDLEAKNTSNTAIQYFIADNLLKLNDNKGRAYSSTTENLYSCISTSVDYYGSGALNPGVSKKFTFIYTVPSDAKGFYYKILSKASYLESETLGEGYKYVKF